jgi:hypothetical protein
LWRIFRGCGHSFHLECNLPDISVCSVCKSLLELKIASLSKTANNAVKKFSPEASGKDDSDDNEDSSDDDDDASDEEIDAHDIEQPNIGESTIGALVSKISSWTHVQPPTN